MPEYASVLSFVGGSHVELFLESDVSEKLARFLENFGKALHLLVTIARYIKLQDNVIWTSIF